MPSSMTMHTQLGPPSTRPLGLGFGSRPANRHPFQRLMRNRPASVGKESSETQVRYTPRPTSNIIDANRTMTADDIVTSPFLQSVLNTCTHTRQQCMNLIGISESYAVSAEQPLSPEAQLELSKQQKLLYSYLAQIRGLNRDALLEVRSTKQATAEARQEVDRLLLRLQNLYYEERHLRGEITACESYE